MESTTCELTWNLDRIYPSFESEGFQQDRRQVESLAGELNTWSASQPVSGQAPAELMEEFLKQYNAYQQLYLRLFSYAEPAIQCGQPV